MIFVFCKTNGFTGQYGLCVWAGQGQIIMNSDFNSKGCETDDLSFGQRCNSYI